MGRRRLARWLAGIARQLARQLPAPPEPTPEMWATMRASDLAAALWDRYRDPDGGPPLSAGARALVDDLEEDNVRALAAHIRAEHCSDADHPPLSHEVTL